MNEPDAVHGPIHLPLRIDGREVPYRLWYFAFGDQRWVAAAAGEIDDGRPVPLRIESACLFGHVFHSAKCDCGYQLDQALRLIERRGRGVVLYGIDQDARGLGIESHFRIYVMRQTENLDTDEVYRRLDAPLDARSYGPVAVMLRRLGVARVALLSNNSHRRRFLLEHGFEVEVEALEAPLDVHNMSTLMLEKEDLGYTWSFRTHGDWLAPLQQQVEGDLERRAAQLVAGTEHLVATCRDEGGWELGRGLEAAAAGAPPPPPGARIVYSTDLPRIDELAAFVRLGASFVVVPFAEIPRWLRDAAVAAGVRVQDWERRNRYRLPRPQWELVCRQPGRDWYRRAERARCVLLAPTAEAAAEDARRLGGLYARAAEQAGIALAVRPPCGSPPWIEVDLVAAGPAARLRARGFRLAEAGPGWALLADGPEEARGAPSLAGEDRP